jgi:hypothetical protein
MHLKKQQVLRGASTKEHVRDKQKAQKGTSTSPKNNNSNKRKEKQQ